jgi:mercuric ion transport protein
LPQGLHCFWIEIEDIKVNDSAGEPGPPPEAENRRHAWFAAGSVIGAVLASACCVVPLALVTLGVSGAWIGNLTALEPFKPYVAVATIAVIGLGFWHVYFRPKPDCKDGTYCARPESSRLTTAALWAGTAVILLAVTIDWWAPLFY